MSRLGQALSTRKEWITLKVTAASLCLIRLKSYIVVHNCCAGKKLVECLLEAKKWPKSIPVITDKGIARMVASALIQGAFFHRSEKVEDKKGYLMVRRFF